MTAIFYQNDRYYAEINIQFKIFNDSISNDDASMVKVQWKLM